MKEGLPCSADDSCTRADSRASRSTSATTAVAAVSTCSAYMRGAAGVQVRSCAVVDGCTGSVVQIHDLSSRAAIVDLCASGVRGTVLAVGWLFPHW